MQTTSYTLGDWHADARIEEMEEGRLMAVISVSNGCPKSASRHTVVFDHAGGTDTVKETENLVHRLLQERYGT
ncbi:hypothetical protein [Noviherbaspirillum massiliense]|uniref:hypothetical protein n=1 Tax=Noviherbaspirillum massiliense TaxID=1465823 RepID=UPI00031ED64B|nr:hypothetical protein [Noviherbaspirillum massiliense]